MTAKTTTGINWHWCGQRAPIIGETIWVQYYPNSGTVNASIAEPECNPANKWQGIVRKALSPNSNSYSVIETENIEGRK